ncbi:MAG: hypothetical protein IT373_38605 [Polyangiaceae bacterium]|nr:hypothetical protein [Polyangiaceae bacterium]
MPSDATNSELPVPPTDRPADEPKPKKKRRWRRRLLIAAAVVVVGTLGLWVAVHKIPWLGPWLADALRAVIGKDAVARLEELVYGVEDKWNQAWKGGDAPKPYWDVPTDVEPPKPIEEAGCTVPAFRPDDVGPVLTSWSAPGDGVWVAIQAQHAGDTPRMYKTLLHPDPKRSWAAVTVVAVDLRQVELHMVLGTQEPASRTPEGEKIERTGLVPESDTAELLAAFNGGFKTEHGQFGVGVGDVVVVPARKVSCLVAFVPGPAGQAELHIGDWEGLGGLEQKALWWRQTPACIAEDGKENPLLVTSEKNTAWGATLDGQTVIRRSAIGVSADHRVLYSGIGDHVTARALAAAMLHAGAVDSAQLDVNWSYPKFVVYAPRASGKNDLVATKLCDGFEFSEDEYLRQKSPRDFFYLTRKKPEATAALVCGPGAGSTQGGAPTPAPAEPGAPAPEGPRGARLEPSRDTEGG